MYEMVKLLTALKQQIHSLLSEYEEHHELQRILDSVEMLLNIPLSTPLAKVNWLSVKKINSLFIWVYCCCPRASCDRALSRVHVCVHGHESTCIYKFACTVFVVRSYLIVKTPIFIYLFYFPCKGSVRIAVSN